MTLKDVELRKLPTGSLYIIATVLEINNDWKTVMSLIPRNPRSEHFEAKYNNEHIKLVSPYIGFDITIIQLFSLNRLIQHPKFLQDPIFIILQQPDHRLKIVFMCVPSNNLSKNYLFRQIEDHARASKRLSAEILFEEWGSSGRIRPTLKTLQDVVKKAEIYRAADYIAQMLGEDPPERPKDGPIAPINLNITEILNNDRTTTIYQKSYGKNNDQAIGNRSTIQMKSESPIAYTLSCNDLPNLSAFKSLRNKETAKMKSENDLVKYTNELIEDYQSNFLPDFNNLMGNTQSASDGAENREGNAKYQETFPDIPVSTEIRNNTELVQFKYEELAKITKNFAGKVVFVQDPPNCKMAGRIGSGGFADVYVGYHGNYGHLAVKKPKLNRAYEKEPEILNRVFNSEIQFLTHFKHNNIVTLIGYSNDGPSPCIVCEYVDGGTLEKKLEEKTLSEKQRINIMIGIAEALKYLHWNATANISSSKLAKSGEQSQKNSFVHGDVKTANILLTKDYVPKLCDFALGKEYEVTNTSLATYLMYTPAYLAPEGFMGTITQETDIYSYGIVLLELLTGLKSIHKTSTGDINLKTYIEENCQNNEINNFLDPFIDKWTKAKEIYTLARACLHYDRKSRPPADEICNTLAKINKE